MRAVHVHPSPTWQLTRDEIESHLTGVYKLRFATSSFDTLRQRGLHESTPQSLAQQTCAHMFNMFGKGRNYVGLLVLRRPSPAERREASWCEQEAVVCALGLRAWAVAVVSWAGVCVDVWHCRRR